jgi:Fe-S oxidoreductase
MVTREEKHSTRGRARLLFEMLNGKELHGGWRNDAVEEALDLCLACKGCKADCPVNVDMATYKAEFRAHHYAGRLRPRAAYSMGLIHWWARLAARAPRLANAAAQAPVLSPLAKAIGGIAPEREIPRFAPETFRRWWAAQDGAWAGATSPSPGPGRVILWVDTFTDHFHPDVARAAVRVLRHAGCEVVVPRAELCCGRPLYDWGFLAQARRLARTTLRELRGDIRAGVPVIGLEPSCVSVFRDDAPDLLHGDEDARRLAGQMVTLTEYLAHLDGYTPPHIDGRALLHGHCHHKSVLDFDAEVRVLEAAGLEVDVPDTGCCGMAGAFGFEAGDHYRVSVAAGERVLLPAVRQADPDTLVVTGGFSCREQIQQQTHRAVLHPAEVLARGLDPASGPAAQNGGIEP